MENDHGQQSIVDKLTVLAMQVVSRRRFMQQVSTGSLTITGVVGAWLSLSAFSPSVPPKCPSPCTGPCVCAYTSTCISGGHSCSCGPGDCNSDWYVQGIMTFEGSNCTPECDCYEC